MKIVEYEAVSTGILDKLTSQVNGFLKEGWQPHGTVQVTNMIRPNDVRVLYTQVMVKYTNENCVVPPQ